MNINDLLEIRTQIVTRSKVQFVHNFVQIHNNIYDLVPKGAQMGGWVFDCQ